MVLLLSSILGGTSYFKCTFRGGLDVPFEVSPLDTPLGFTLQGGV